MNNIRIFTRMLNLLVFCCFRGVAKSRKKCPITTADLARVLLYNRAMERLYSKVNVLTFWFIRLVSSNEGAVHKVLQSIRKTLSHKRAIASCNSSERGAANTSVTSDTSWCDRCDFCVARRRYSAKAGSIKKMYLVNKNIVHLIDDIFWKMSFKTETEAEKVIICNISNILCFWQYINYFVFFY